MGASSWEYVVDYQQDIGKALEELRQAVFHAKAYYKGIQTWLEMAETIDGQETFSDDFRQVLTDLKDNWRNKPLPPEPTSIKELLEQNAEEGTHSIIDMYRGVSQTADFGTVSPLTPTQLQTLFGTLYPTRTIVAQQLDNLWKLRSR